MTAICTMIGLARFKENHLSVSWGVLLIGFQGPGFNSPQLEVDEIRNFVEQRFLIVSEQDTIGLVRLLDSLDEGRCETIQQLEQLAFNEHCNLSFDLRKWRALMLQDLLLKLLPNIDPMKGLLELTEFWLSFNSPADSPHVVQGVNDNRFPELYYTVESYQSVLDEHKHWLSDEFKKLRN